MSRPTRYSGKRENSSAIERSSLNGTDPAAASALSKARAQFNQPLVQLQAIFPEWKEEDLISVLEEVKGDIETAVARISEGHAEQWGAVKHKKDKKLTPGRERERDTPGHSTIRGSSSPRGRGRGGRGSNVHATGSRQNRERNTNGVSSTVSVPLGTETAAELGSVSAVPEVGAADNEQKVPEDSDHAQKGENIGDSSISRKERPKVAAPQPAPNTQLPKTIPPAGNLRKTPIASGLSWAQIAKPSQKPVQPPPDSLSNHTISSSVPKEHTIPISTTAPEEPTTIEPHILDDEPPSESYTAPSPPSVDSATDGWVAAEPEEHLPSLPPTAAPESSSPDPTSNVEHIESSSTTIIPNVVNAVSSKTDPLPPPPGLTSPTPSTPNPPKPSTPLNVRPGLGIHRPSSRFKTDQAVVMPPQSLPAVAAFGITGKLPLQFGSLSLSGDDNENQILSIEGTIQQPQIAATGDSTSLAASHPIPALSNQPSEVIHPPQVANSPVNGYRTHNQPPDPVRESPSQSVVNQPATVSGRTQSPAAAATLAHAPISSPALSAIHQATSAQHGLAGLTHTPQSVTASGGANHSHSPSYGQPGSFPLQAQQFDNNPLPMANQPLSALGQLSQSQGQGFLRQQDSPFYNQAQNPDHNYGSGNAGFNQLGQNMQSGFSGGPNMANDFAYDGQRNVYDTYSGPGSFTGRGVHRQDDLKSIIGASTQGHAIPPQTHAQSGQLGNGQSSGGQGQYPGMSAMGNPFYYNMNMNPYGYGNQFYSPAFSPFVNHLYQAGGTQTPPHGSKPSNVGGTSGIPGANINTYSSNNNPGHMHHASGGFDGDSGVGGTPTYHQTGNLPADFPKGGYGGGQGMGFLGNVGTAGAAINRGPNPGSGAAVTSPDTGFKGYGITSGPSAGLVAPDKQTSNQPTRGPNSNSAPQQFYQNPRFSAGQGVYPQQQQQPQNDGYYNNYQRW